ncbi:ABC transporter substrate-binding protein [soil metagenome]
MTSEDRVNDGERTAPTLYIRAGGGDHRRRGEFRRGSGSIILLILMALVLAACGTTGEGTASPDVGERSPDEGGEDAGGDEDVEQLTWRVQALVNLDSARALDNGSKSVQALMTESLVTLDDDLNVVPWLAESWEQVDDLTYRYTLRPDVTFWDGSPLTVEDVIYSFERHNDPDVGSIVGTFRNVESVQETGDREVTVTLTQPQVDFQWSPTFAPIVQKAFAEEIGEDFGAPGSDTVMGTGPYRLVNFEADTSVDLARNDDYWGERPIFENVRIVLLADAEAAKLAMRAGEIDGAFQITPTSIEEWRGLEGVAVESAPPMSPAFFAWDLRVEPWNDVHVRRAIAHSLDREGLVESLFPGAGEPATSLVPKAQWDGLDLPEGRVDEIYNSLRTYEFDLDQAREELEQSNFPDGFSATVEYADAKPPLGRAAETLAQNLAQIGIDLEVREVPLSQEIAAVTGHEGGFRALSFEAEEVNPTDFPAFMLPSEFARPGGFNVPHYLNEEVDALIDEASVTADVEERAEALAELMRIIAEDLPYLPIWWQSTVAAVSDDYTFENYHALWFKKGIWVSHIRSAG